MAGGTNEREHWCLQSLKILLSQSYIYTFTLRGMSHVCGRARSIRTRMVAAALSSSHVVSSLPTTEMMHIRAMSSSPQRKSDSIDILGNFRAEWKEVSQLKGVIAKFKHLFGRYGLWFPAIYFGPFWIGPMVGSYAFLQMVSTAAYVFCASFVIEIPASPRQRPYSDTLSIKSLLLCRTGTSGWSQNS